LIRKELDSFTPEELAEAPPGTKQKHVLFSAHGVPRSYIEAGDPYQAQIQECVAKISEQLPQDNVEIHLSYQSRVGPIEWLRPYTDDVLPELGE
jgi:ferrochelatase